MIVVDSSVWIAKFRGEANVATQKLERVAHDRVEEILVGDLILLELLQGARDERHADFIAAELRAFPIESMLDADLAKLAARNFRSLRGRGVTLRKTVDLIVATFCIERGHTLLHQYRDFESVGRHLPLKTI